MPRLIAVGDIHGCGVALRTLLRAVDLRDGDTLVTLGDYVDRGGDSRGVIDTLLKVEAAGRLVPLLGNHEEMMLGALRGSYPMGAWLRFGGEQTLASYPAEEVPAEHLAFLDRCRPYHETGEAIFVHANYVADEPLARQPAEALRWQSLHDHFPQPHQSGKRVFVGHTAQRDGDCFDAGHLVCLDTFCHGGGWLTAMDTATGRVWQASEAGDLRESDDASL